MFLDVLFIRNETHLDTTVYWKDTHNDLYLHWDAFAPVSWKRRTLRTLVNRAYLVCSDKKLLNKELETATGLEPTTTWLKNEHSTI